MQAHLQAIVVDKLCRSAWNSLLVWMWRRWRGPQRPVPNSLDSCSLHFCIYTYFLAELNYIFVSGSCLFWLHMLCLQSQKKTSDRGRNSGRACVRACASTESYSTGRILDRAEPEWALWRGCFQTEMFVCSLNFVGIGWISCSFGHFYLLLHRLRGESTWFYQQKHFMKFGNAQAISVPSVCPRQVVRVELSCCAFEM